MTSSISGLGAGIDLSGVVTQLMQVERAPEQAMNTARLASLARQTSWSTIGSKLTALQTAAAALDTTSAAASSTASSSDTAVLSATAGPGAQLGSFGVVVDNLATAQQLRTGALSTPGLLVGAGQAVLSAGLAPLGATAVTVSGTTPSGAHSVEVQTASQPARVYATAAPALSFTGGNDVTVTLADGSSRTITLAGNYLSADALLADINAQLGGVATAQLVAGQLELASRDEGSQATLSVTGSATAALGLTTTTGTGSDAKVSLDGGPATVVSHLDGSTPVDLGNGVTLTSGGHLGLGKADVNVLRTDDTSTVTDLVGMVNASGSPMSASLVNTGDGSSAPYRLVLTANGSGTAGSVTLDTSGINVLQPDQLAHVVDAVDAHLRVGGSTVTRSSNSISDLVPGVTLNLVHASDGAGTPGATPTTVAVTRDPAATATKVQAFVDAFNAALAEIKKDTAYDATTKKGQPLNGDPTARGITDNLLDKVLGATGTGSAVKVLSQLGIQTTRDGALTFDSSAFQKAVQKDPDGAASLLSGFAKGVEDYAKATTDFDGVVTTAGKAAGDDAASRQKGIDDFEVRMTAMEASYNAKFSALDALLGTLKAQQSTLKSALASLPQSSG